MTAAPLIPPHLRDWVEPTAYDMSLPPIRHNGRTGGERVSVCAHVHGRGFCIVLPNRCDYVTAQTVADPTTRDAVRDLCLRVVASDDPMPPYAFIDLLTDLLDGEVRS